jgi:hypothetical protein
MIAAYNDRADCVRLLIDAGADKEVKNRVQIGSCFPLVFFFISRLQCSSVSLFS